MEFSLVGGVRIGGPLSGGPKGVNYFRASAPDTISISSFVITA